MQLFILCRGTHINLIVHVTFKSTATSSTFIPGNKKVLETSEVRRTSILVFTLTTWFEATGIFFMVI